MYVPNSDRNIYFTVDIRIHGLGGHSSVPSKTYNPILAANELILSLAQKAWFGFDSFDNINIYPVLFEAGSKGNIIPETACLSFRGECVTEEQREKLEQITERAAESIEISHRVKIVTEWKK